MRLHLLSRVFLWVSQMGTPKAGPSTQKAHPCDMCDPVLKDIFAPGWATENTIWAVPKHRHVHHCGRDSWGSINLDQMQRPQSGENFFRKERSQAWFVKIYRSQVLEKAFTCREGWKNFVVSSGLTSCRPLAVGRNHTEALSVGRPFVYQISFR